MPRLTESEMKANEEHFIQFIKHKTKLYMWKDKGNSYSMTSGKIVPHNMKGFVEIAGIVSKNFVKIFVELPDLVEINGFVCSKESINKEKILNLIEDLK